ncbi:MAG: hypothetical protein K9W45_11280 [Candidatus Heimdallarchaeum aukensis]|uniref:Uncharacterized protein n=1 Tax=Candidatus Heimdallarchaeum aukensis TaxID=2876573 RepID=A0A9Y1BK71_9ARCH|nr:MAG: hypothetical protein K9W45_11280 [Candidatus Heimdallarchaeum aukensis]
MTTYYFDIETYGKKEEDSYNYEIITIQYQKILQQTGKKLSGEPLTILKSWENSEEEIIKKFLRKLNIKDKWNFTPVGSNLKYDFIVLSKRAKKYGLNIELEKLLTHPHVDISSTLFILNKGSFKGARLDTFTKKKKTGEDILDLYKDKKYDEIIEYIETEAKEFLKLYQWLLKTLPSVYEQHKKQPNSVFA